MKLGAYILVHSFGHPSGILGRLGGFVMAHMNQSMANGPSNTLHVQPNDRVLDVEEGFCVLGRIALVVDE